MLTTADQVLAGFRAPIPILKLSATTVAGVMQSLWASSGRPQAGATVSAGAAGIPIATDTGAMPFTNPSGSSQSNLAKLSGASTVAGTLFVFDRMLVYGFDGTSTSLQSMASTATKGGVSVGAAVDRPSSGDGEMWIEMPTAATTQRTATIVYTNQAGTGSRSITVVIPAAAAGPAGCLIPVTPLATSGGVTDNGVRSVQSIQIAAGSLGAGTSPSHIVLLRRLASLPIPLANAGAVLDWAQLGLPRIYDSACLQLAWLPGTTSSGNLHADLVISQG